MTNRSRNGRSRRQVLGLMSGAAAASILPQVRMSFAQANVQSAQPLPPLLMESYPDQFTVEAARIYARELAELGIAIDHKPQAFGQILGKVYGRKDVVTAMMGFGSPEERLDPDFYLRSIFSTGGSFNASHYSNPEFDRIAEAQQVEIDPTKRQALIDQAQRILAEDLPSWNVCSRHAINTVNKRLFRNFKPSKGLGLELYHVAPYLELEPVGNVKEVNVATTFRMSSAHPFTERSANGRGFLRFIYDTFLRYDGELNLKPWAAESYRLVNPTTYELKLRSGMKWHDGKPVTIEDAKFTFDYLLKWKPPFWDSFMVPVKSAEIVDASTLRVHLHSPSATFATLSLVQIAHPAEAHLGERARQGGRQDPDGVGRSGQRRDDRQRPIPVRRLPEGCRLLCPGQQGTLDRRPQDRRHPLHPGQRHRAAGRRHGGREHPHRRRRSHPAGRQAPRAARRDRPHPDAFGHDRELLAGQPAAAVQRQGVPSRHVLRPAQEEDHRHRARRRRAIRRAAPRSRRSSRSWIPKDLPDDEYDLAKARKILEDSGYKIAGGKLIMK